MYVCIFTTCEEFFRQFIFDVHFLYILMLYLEYKESHVQ